MVALKYKKGLVCRCNTCGSIFAKQPKVNYCGICKTYNLDRNYTTEDKRKEILKILEDHSTNINPELHGGIGRAIFVNEYNKIIDLIGLLCNNPTI